MSDDFHRWRVEHARDPDTDTTPLTEAAAEAGAAMLARELAELALPAVRETAPAMADEIESDEEVFRAFGDRLYEHIDFDALPSRIDIRKQMDVEQGELNAPEVGEKRLKLGLEQLSEDAIVETAEVALDAE